MLTVDYAGLYWPFPHCRIDMSFPTHFHFCPFQISSFLSLRSLFSLYINSSIVNLNHKIVKMPLLSYDSSVFMKELITGFNWIYKYLLGLRDFLDFSCILSGLVEFIWIYRICLDFLKTFTRIYVSEVTPLSDSSSRFIYQAIHWRTI